MKPKLFNIGDRVVDVYGTAEGVIIAYTLRDQNFSEVHMYKVQWDKRWFPRWIVQYCISKIETQ